MVSPFPLFYGAAALSLALAIAVAVASPTRQGMRLALLLLTEAGTSSMTALHGTSDGAVQAAALASFVVAVGMSVLAFVWFLQTVRTPWSRLVSGPAFWVWAVYAVTLVALGAARPEWFDFDTPGRSINQVVGGLLFLLGLVMAIDQYRRSGVATRRTDAWFLAAFGWRDLSLAVILPIFAFTETGALDDAATFAMPISLMVFYLLIAYAILRASLFDIDLKIKFGISRTTVAAIIAGAALVGSEAIERLLGIDQLWPAVMIGATMSLAVRPLLRLGDRLADSAMPKVQDTDEYRAKRAAEVYRSAWEAALRDGIVTERERAVLASLAGSLGLSRDDVKKLQA